jgi:putative transcriptional regulator
MDDCGVRLGCLLVASPELLDPNFSRAVVLIVNHDQQGSFGLVLNRPLDRTLADVLPDLAPGATGVPVLQGGPVQTEMLQLVSRTEETGRVIVPNLSIGTSLEDVLTSPAGIAGLRAYLGYAGWGAGQLEKETASGGWIIAAARSGHVFDVPPEELWISVLRELGGPYTWMALGEGDPTNN